MFWKDLVLYLCSLMSFFATVGDRMRDYADQARAYLRTASVEIVSKADFPAVWRVVGPAAADPKPTAVSNVVTPADKEAKSADKEATPADKRDAPPR